MALLKIVPAKLIMTLTVWNSDKYFLHIVAKGFRKHKTLCLFCQENTWKCFHSVNLNHYKTHYNSLNWILTFLLVVFSFNMQRSIFVLSIKQSGLSCMVCTLFYCIDTYIISVPSILLKEFQNDRYINSALCFYINVSNLFYYNIYNITLYKYNNMVRLSVINFSAVTSLK